MRISLKNAVFVAAIFAVSEIFLMGGGCDPNGSSKPVVKKAPPVQTTQQQLQNEPGGDSGGGHGGGYGG